LGKKGNSAYEVKLPDSWKGYNVFNEVRIKKFVEATFPGQPRQNQHPDSILTNEGKEEYEVEEILDERQNNNRHEYLVQWRDYGPEDDTWEPQGNLKNAPRAIRQYKSRGQASGKLGYHVVNQVTQGEPPTETKLRSTPIKSNQPGLIHLPHSLEVTNRIIPGNQEQQEINTTHDSDVTATDNTALGSVVMGKLCRRALALIKHKVGADGSISEHMARALASWLRLQGITIYTETEL
jgi:hypothetical protein